MAHRKNVSITPPASPAMDRPSIAFAWFLNSIEMGLIGPDPIYMDCNLCGESICAVETGDTLRELLNTALAHDC